MQAPTSKEIAIHTAAVNNALSNIESLIFGTHHRGVHSIVRACASKTMEYLRRQIIATRQLALQKGAQDLRVNIQKIEEATKTLAELTPKVWITIDKSLYDPDYRIKSNEEFIELSSKLEKVNATLQVILGSNPNIVENALQIITGLETLATNLTFKHLHGTRDSLINDLFTRASDLVIRIRSESNENQEGEKLSEIAQSLEASLRLFSGLMGETNPTTSFLAQERLFEITGEVRVNLANVSKIAASNPDVVSGCLALVDKLSKLATLIAEIDQLNKSNLEHEVKTVSTQLSKLLKLKNQSKEATTNIQLDLAIKELSSDLSTSLVAAVQDRLNNMGDEDSLIKLTEVMSSIKRNLHITEKYGNKKLISNAKGLNALLENLTTLIFGEKSELEKILEIVVKKIAQQANAATTSALQIHRDKVVDVGSQLQSLAVPLIQTAKGIAESPENARKPLYELMTNIEVTSWNLQSLVKSKSVSNFGQELIDSLNALALMIGELTSSDLEVSSELFISRYVS